jgi:hypothetical protein
MTAYYYAKGGTVVAAVHHDQSEVKDPSVYGTGTYIIVDLTGDFPSYDPDLPGFDYPTITAQMLSDTVKNECQYRILNQISLQAQASINGYVADIGMNANPSPAQINDAAMAAAIHDWINRPNGMLAASDTLITNNDQQWYLDGKWPVWDPGNTGWTAFVARFTI